MDEQGLDEALLASFSRTVRDVALELDAKSGSPTAGEITAALQRRHPDYFEGKMGRARLDAGAGKRRPVADWLGDVRDLFEMPAIQSSHHQVVDAELMLFGLSALDEVVRANLLTAGVLRVLDGEDYLAVAAGPADASSSGPADASSTGPEPTEAPGGSRLLSHVGSVQSLAGKLDGGELVASTPEGPVRIRLDGSVQRFPGRDRVGKRGGPVVYLDDDTILNVGTAKSVIWSFTDNKWESLPTPAGFSCMDTGEGYALAGSAEGSIWRIDRKQNRFWEEIHRGQPPIVGLAVSAEVLATAHTNGEVRLWKLQQSGRGMAGGEPFYVHRLSPAIDVSVAVDGRVAFVTDEGVVLVLGPVESDEVERRADLTIHSPTKVSFSPDGALLAVGSSTGTLTTLVVDSLDAVMRLRPHDAEVSGLVWAPDGRTLFSAGSDGRVIAHDIAPVLRPDAHVDWIDDEPARVDSLKRRVLASFIALQLRNFANRNPARSFLVHLDGPWGSGKSTLLDYLEDEIHTDADDPWLVTRFDAWRQSKVGPPWLALTAAIRKTLRDDRGWWTRLGLRLLEWARLAGTGQWATTVIFGLIVLVALVYLIVGPGWSGLQSVRGVTTVTVGALGVVGGIWSALKGATGVVFKSSSRRARDFEESQRDPMDDVARHFAWLLSKARKTIVMFIDDLDRCGDKYVVDLLDAVQTLMRTAPRFASRQEGSHVPGLIFVVAADGRWIRKSYEKAHETFAESVSEPGRPLGYLFLEKLFQVTVPLPSLSPQLQDDFLAGVLTIARGIDHETPAVSHAELAGRIEASTTEHEIVGVLNEALPEQRLELADAAVKALSSPRLEKETEHALQKFARLLEPNPRSMKRFVLSYSINRGVRTVEGSAVDVDSLALWTVLRSRWPSLGDYLATRPEMIERVGNKVEDLIALGVPHDVAALLSDPDKRLSRLVDFPRSGSLTADVVRRCCGTSSPDEETVRLGARGLF